MKSYERAIKLKRDLEKLRAMVKAGKAEPPFDFDSSLEWSIDFQDAIKNFESQIAAQALQKFESRVIEATEQAKQDLRAAIEIVGGWE